MKKYFALLVLLSMLLIITSCSPKQDDYYADLNSFSITTLTNETDINGDLIVRPNLDGGKFTISWSTDFNTPSGNAIFTPYIWSGTLDRNNDYITHRNCGGITASCQSSGSLNCVLGTDNVINCGDTRSLNISGLLGNAIAAKLNVTGEVCVYDDTLTEICDTRVIPVHFETVPL